MSYVSGVPSAQAQYETAWEASAGGSGKDSAGTPAEPNEVWSADFMADALWSGRRFRTFNVLDDFNSEALRSEIDTNLPARRIVRTLDELVEP